mgnify:CR=1 FL=1
MLTAEPSIEKLRWIMAQLRDPETGCPWDLKQTFASIIPHTIEEAYEVADAIEQEDFAELEKELGDLLFQVVFYSQLGAEEKRFDFDCVLSAICEKLIRRHPHVFASSDFSSDAEIKANWENEKSKERQQKNNDQSLSMLADIPRNLPALSQAAKIQKRCAHVGFDWDNIDDVFNVQDFNDFDLPTEKVILKYNIDTDADKEIIQRFIKLSRKYRFGHIYINREEKIYFSHKQGLAEQYVIAFNPKVENEYANRKDFIKLPNGWFQYK